MNSVLTLAYCIARILLGAGKDSILHGIGKPTYCMGEHKPAYCIE
jgi:hypothetical protein